MNSNILNIIGLPNSQVTTYEGLEGLKIISRNSVNTKGILRIYEMTYASLNEIFSKEEAEEVRKEFLKRKTEIHELTNKIYREKYTEIEEFHKVCMKIRYIDPKKITLDTEFLVYNDITAFYSYGENIFGVEIKNEQFAQTQKQIFDYIWNKGEFPIIGKNGRTSII